MAMNETTKKKIQLNSLYGKFKPCQLSEVPPILESIVKSGLLPSLETRTVMYACIIVQTVLKTYGDIALEKPENWDSLSPSAKMEEIIGGKKDGA